MSGVSTHVMSGVPTHVVTGMPTHVVACMPVRFVIVAIRLLAPDVSLVVVVMTTVVCITATILRVLMRLVADGTL